jgi:hypothetical protein
MGMLNLAFQKSGLWILSLVGSMTLFAQDSQGVQGLLNSKHYVFKAETAYPASGRLRQLTPGYTVKVSGDTVVADLPYFGVAYSAPTNMSGGGINFTSVKPGYLIAQDKKQAWQIQIRPSDTDVEQLSLTVYDNSKADLRVTNKNRQPISFRGYITKK